MQRVGRGSKVDFTAAVSLVLFPLPTGFIFRQAVCQSHNSLTHQVMKHSSSSDTTLTIKALNELFILLTIGSTHYVVSFSKMVDKFILFLFVLFFSL